MPVLSLSLQPVRWRELLFCIILFVLKVVFVFSSQSARKPEIDFG